MHLTKPAVTAPAANDDATEATGPCESGVDAPLPLKGEFPQRRLSDQIAGAYFRAREERYNDVAEHLKNAFETLLAVEARLYPGDRRTNLDSVTVLRNELVLTTRSIEQPDDDIAL